MCQFLNLMFKNRGEFVNKLRRSWKTIDDHKTFNKFVFNLSKIFTFFFKVSNYPTKIVPLDEFSVVSLNYATAFNYNIKTLFLSVIYDINI